VTTPSGPLDADRALARLREGNARFTSNLRSLDVLATQARRDQLVSGQEPFAVILSCSDSRVPAEIVFDCGLGDLFVVRVAGNVVAPSLVGSVEFAAAAFGTPLVVVMGHTQCGAVGATLDTFRSGRGPASENIRDIVSRIAPSVQELVDAGFDGHELAHRAVRANVRASANHLRHGSALLERLIAAGTLRVVGAEYDLETGVVDFFDEG
jgi:carbonic anhydrase